MVRRYSAFFLPLLVVTLVFGAPPTQAPAQTPFENGISVAEITDGLQGPSSIARDSLGRIYVASIYDMNGSGNPTNIFRVLPDGTVELFTAPLLDPDVLCLDAADQVYVGQWPGTVTKIDPATGVQSTWIHDTRLGNIDGMTFDANGDMLITAIDHLKIHRVDAMTKQIAVFADLTSLSLQGFGSIIVNPADQSVFVASPKDGDLVHLNPDGTLDNAALADGFQHMGQLAIQGDDVFVSDNVAGIIYRVDMVTGNRSILVDRIRDYGGALLALGGNEFLATRQSSDLTDGRLYRIAPMDTSLGGSPRIGHPLMLNLSSPADAGRPVYLFFTLNPGTILLPTGRTLPVNLSAFIMLQSLYDAAGQWSLSLSIPNDNGLVGLDLFTCHVSTNPGIFGISHSYQVTILP